MSPNYGWNWHGMQVIYRARKAKILEEQVTYGLEIISING